MGRYQPFHDLPASQYEALKRDVEQRGIVNPILVDEHDKTIDGHQRRKVAADLGVECPRIVVEGLSDDEKMSLALALNTFRRHLTGVERSTALQKMSQLGMSQRRIAAATGVSQRTVGRALAGEAHAAPDNVDPETGEIVSPSGDTPVSPMGDVSTSVDTSTAVDKPKRVIGTDGKSYPATKPQVENPADLVSKSDVGYRAATSKAIVRASDLLLLDADRCAAISLPEDRDAHLAFVSDLGAWLERFGKGLRSTNLRSVK